MDNRVVTKKGRERAMNEARSLRLERTMIRIKDGASANEVWDTAFSEHLEIHINCPCCRGSEGGSRLIADHIDNLLKDYPRVDEFNSHC